MTMTATATHIKKLFTARAIVRMTLPIEKISIILSTQMKSSSLIRIKKKKLLIF
jgi:hypothetical protein